MIYNLKRYEITDISEILEYLLAIVFGITEWHQDSVSRFTHITRNIMLNYFLLHINHHLIDIVLTILIQANFDFNFLLYEIFAFKC